MNLIRDLEIGDLIEWGAQGEIWEVIGVELPPGRSERRYKLYFGPTGASMPADASFLAGSGARLVSRQPVAGPAH